MTAAAHPDIEKLTALWTAGKTLDIIAEEIGLSRSGVYHAVRRLGLPYRRKPKEAEPGPRAGLRRCLKHGGQFWTPDRRRVQICPDCTRENSHTYTENIIESTGRRVGVKGGAG